LDLARRRKVRGLFFIGARCSTELIALVNIKLICLPLRLTSVAVDRLPA